MQKPKGYREIILRELSETVTNADQADLSKNYPLAQRGMRKGIAGSVLEKAFGTQHIYPTDKYPVAPVPAAQSNVLNMCAPFSDFYDAATGKRHNIHIAYDSTTDKFLRINVDTNDGESVVPTWEDLTRVLRGTVSSYGVDGFGEYYIDVTTSTITENLSTAETISTGECNGWVLYNKSLAEYSKSVTGVVNNGSGLCRVTIAAHGLVANAFISIAGVTGATGANGNFKVIVVNATTIDLSGSTFGGVYSGGGTVTRAGQTLLFVTNTTNNGATVRFQVAAKMDVTNYVLHFNTDTIYIYRSRAWYERQVSAGSYGIGYTIGTAPRISMIDNEPQSKRTLYISKLNVSNVYEGSIPLRIQRHDERLRFYMSSSAAVFSYPSGWYLEEATHPIYYDKFGTIETPLTTATSTLVKNSGSPNTSETANAFSAWLGVTATPGNTGATIYRGVDGGKIKYIRGYITPVFDGFQRGDPVLEFFTSSGGLNAPTVAFGFYVNLAKMNQHITGLEVYAQLITDVEYESSATTNQNIRNFSDGDCQLVKTIYFDRPNDSIGGAVTVTVITDAITDALVSLTWTLSPLQGNWEVQYEKITPSWGNVIVGRTDLQIHNNTINKASIGSTVLGLPSIVEQLGRGVVKKRTVVAPLMATRAGDANGSLTVTALDDRTLASSIVGANGLAWDDAFPDVVMGNSGSRPRIALQSKSQIVGLEFLPIQYQAQRPSQVVLVLKKHEKELVDLSGGNNVYTADVTGWKSIVRVPNGILWNGAAGIYFQSIRGDEQIINRNTLNEYNGEMLCDDGVTSVTTDAYREAAVAGYIPLARQVIFQVQQNKLDGSGSEYVCKFFNIDTGKWSADRVIGTSATGRNVSFIGKRNDKTVNLSILGIGVLKYPVIGKFEDEITSAGLSQSVGFESSFLINLGEMYSFDPLMRLWDVSIHFKANIVSGSPTFTIELIANDETTAFDTHTVSMSAGSQKTMKVKERGSIWRLRVRVKVTAANNYLLRNWVINTFRLGFVPEERIGG